MSYDYQTFTSVSFPEYTAISLDQSTGNKFDIILEGEFSPNNYCIALIDKVFTIPKSDFLKFLNHQCSLVSNSFIWLNRFEKLLSENEKLFSDKGQLSRHTKLYYLIENKREKIQNASEAESDIIHPNDIFNGIAHDRIYCFAKTKSIADKMKDFTDKILFLEDQITEYGQYPPHIVNHSEQDFVKQCQLEVIKVTRQHDLKEKLELMKQPASTEFKPMPVNTESKSWAHVFFQLMQTMGENGKPILAGTVKDVVDHICKCYCQMDGTPFNPNTIRTYLTKGKPDSRPKGDKEIDLDMDSI
jgi:hypothetical protein